MKPLPPYPEGFTYLRDSEKLKIREQQLREALSKLERAEAAAYERHRDIDTIRRLEAELESLRSERK